MNKPRLLSLLIVPALLLMGATTVRAGGSPVACGWGVLGCKDWHLSSLGVQCTDLFARNFKNYAVKSWACDSSNNVVPGVGSCDEVNTQGDCCISSNTIGCGSITTTCPCPCP